MRVVIEVVAGPLAGRKFHLVRNQRLEVGSTARADLCIRGDSGLAPQHFAFETDFQVCRVRDVSGSGQTLVNGQAVESTIVRSGDHVQAGNSRFSILVEGDAKEAPAQVAQTKPAKTAPVKRTGVAHYNSIVCDTGLTRYEGFCAQFPPGELAAALAAESPLYLLADNRRLQDGGLAQLPEPHYLFDWLGESAPSLSPLIVLPGEAANGPALVGSGWGRDGIIAFFAKEGNDGAVAALRSSVKTAENQVIGICWPKILAYLLSHYQANFVKGLMEPFACALMESPTAADRWQLFSTEPLEDRLQALNLQPQEAKV
jgi:hypothetical protein